MLKTYFKTTIPSKLNRVSLIYFTVYIKFVKMKSMIYINKCQLELSKLKFIIIYVIQCRIDKKKYSYRFPKRA